MVEHVNQLTPLLTRPLLFFSTTGYKNGPVRVSTEIQKFIIHAVMIVTRKI